MSSISAAAIDLPPWSREKNETLLPRVVLTVFYRHGRLFRLACQLFPGSFCVAPKTVRSLSVPSPRGYPRSLPLGHAVSRTRRLGVHRLIGRMVLVPYCFVRRRANLSPDRNPTSGGINIGPYLIRVAGIGGGMWRRVRHPTCTGSDAGPPCSSTDAAANVAHRYFLRNSFCKWRGTHNNQPTGWSLYGKSGSA